MHVHLPASLTFSLVIIGLAIVMTSTTITTITSAKAQLHSSSTHPTAITAIAVVGTSSSSSSSLSGDQFSARLTGDNEVPQVNTDATGRIRLIVNSQQDALDYQISLSNLNGIVTGAHIHSGGSGTNGPIVANLNVHGAFASASAGGGGGGGSATTSTSTGGTVTSADLKGPLAGKQISGLIKLIKDGKAYVNVHTDQNPDGEIRGQLAPSSSDNEDIDTSTSTGASATASSTSPSASTSATVP
jgi:Cu/Zn superoxide dismutase